MALDVDALCKELVRRGWFVTEAELMQDSVIVGFNFLPRHDPNWLKAFRLPFKDATPDAFEREIDLWRADVLRRLDDCELTPVLRRLLAEHGADKVREAMNARAFV